MILLLKAIHMRRMKYMVIYHKQNFVYNEVIEGGVIRIVTNLDALAETCVEGSTAELKNVVIENNDKDLGQL